MTRGDIYMPCTVCVIGNIVVKKKYRNQGIGTQLFEYIKNVLKLMSKEWDW